MTFDEALQALTRLRTAANELETELGARPQFVIINDVLRNFESLLKVVTEPKMTVDLNLPALEALRTANTPADEHAEGLAAP